MVLGEWRLAVDFGTSNTAAAMLSSVGTVEPLTLGEGGFVMPSGVLLWDGQVYTGAAAQRQAAVHPEGFAGTPKRLLGGQPVLLDSGLVEPVVLVQAVLAEVYRKALRVQGGTAPAGVVLTYPQAWRGHRLGLLGQAAVGAGMPADRVRMVSEPVAAAWHYAASGRVAAPAPGALLGVLDFGGGTVDVALLQVVEGGTERFVVVDSDGADPLGGDDFDTMLMGWALEQIRAEGLSGLAGMLSAGQGREVLVLRDQVRGAKHTLSERASAAVGVAGGGQEWVGTVTRREFEALVGSDLDRVVGLVAGLLERNGAGPQELDRLYLTGGSTQIPALQDRLEAAYPGKVATLDDPKQVTALGALQVPLGNTTPVPALAADPAPSNAANVPPSPTVPVPTPVPPAGGAVPRAWPPGSVAAHAQEVPGGPPPLVPGSLGNPAPPPPPPPPPSARPGWRKPVLFGGAIAAALTLVAVLVNAWLPGSTAEPDAASTNTSAPRTPTPTPSPSPTPTSASPTSAAPTTTAPTLPTPTRPTITLPPVPSTPAPDSQDPLDRLLALVPATAGECEGLDVYYGVASAICFVDLDENRLLYSTYWLFADQESMDSAFDVLLGEPSGVAATDCPNVPGSGTYNWDEVEVGRFGCTFAGNLPRLFWTHNDYLVMGEATGYEGEQEALWTWWIDHGAVGPR